MVRLPAALLPQALLILIAWVALGTVAAANPSVNPQAALDQGKLAYQRHEYGTVVETVQPLLYPSIELGSEESVVEAHRLLALSFFFMKKMPEARQEVVSIYSLRPGFQLDPIVEPPVAVRFFQNIRKEQDERLQEIRQRQIEEEENARKEDERRRAAQRAKAERIYVEKTIVKHSRLIATLPFGIGQSQNGQMRKAWLFGTSEAIFGALSVASWIAINQLYPNGKFQPGSETTARGLFGVQLASGAAFWLLVAAGIIDAHVHFQPDGVKIRELPSAPTKKSDLKIGLTPLLSPGFFGLGAQGAF